MARAAVWLVGTATVVAAVDLAHKAAALADPTASVTLHPRSTLYALGVAAISALWAFAIMLTRSRSIALGGGIFVGGAAGNVVSLVLWPSVDGVPNPLLARELAFNLADVAVVVGLALVVLGVAAFAVQNNGRLGERVRL
jgi:lipoprotein signal peptidase